MSTLLIVTSSTRPASPAAGDTYFETDTNKIIVWSGSAWKEYQDNGRLYSDSDITGLSPRLWLDGGNGDFYTDAAKGTQVTANNAFVGCWADRAGNGFDFAQTTESFQPNIITNVGRVNNTGLIYGGDKLTFTGTSSSDTSTNMTVFMIFRYGRLDGSYLIQTSDSSTRARTVKSGDNYAVQFLPFANSSNFNTAYSTANTAKLMEDTCLMGIRVDNSANTTEVFFNGGSAVGSTTAGSGSFLKNTITTELFDETSSEDPSILLDFMVFPTNLSNANMDTVYSYLSKKYDVTVTAVS